MLNFTAVFLDSRVKNSGTLFTGGLNLESWIRDRIEFQNIVLMPNTVVLHAKTLSSKPLYILSSTVELCACLASNP